MSGALLACVFLFAACSSSGSSKTKTTETIGNSVPNTDATTVPPAPLAFSACSLASPATVKQILGVTAPGTETDSGVVQRTCKWATGPSSTNITAATMYLGMIRTSETNVGYGSNVVGLTPQVLQGLGDSATFSTGTGSSGVHEGLLVAKKGTVSVSVTVFYPAATNLPSTLQADLTTLVKTVFTKLHA